MDTRAETTRHPGGVVSQVGIIVHDGREFSSGGGYVSPEYVIGYVKRAPAPATGCVLTLWDGTPIGTGYRVSTWRVRAPRAWYSSETSAYRFKVGDRWYAGRGAGEGMIWRGRAMREGA